MAVSKPAINIIIPNWNGKKLLAQCLESLQNQTYHDFSITVIDNGSSDGSVTFLQKQYPDVHCISFSVNRGFSVAVNEGIRNSTSPYIFLLNNDIEVAADCLERLMIQVEQLPEFDFFSLKMMNYHQRNLLDGAGDGIMRGGVGYRYGTMEEDCERYNRGSEVFGVCGGAALYRKKFFKTVGLFDEDFFAYLEDVDLNLRARRFGLRCYYIPTAVVYHIGSATSGPKINAMTVCLSTKNNINIIVKNYPVTLLIKFLPAVIVYQFFWLLFVLKKGEFISYLKGLAKGIAQMPKMLRKRGEIAKQQRISIREFSELIKQSEYLVINSIMARREAGGKRNNLFRFYKKLFF